VKFLNKISRQLGDAWNFYHAKNIELQFGKEKTRCGSLPPYRLSERRVYREQENGCLNITNGTSVSSPSLSGLLIPYRRKLRGRVENGA